MNSIKSFISSPHVTLPCSRLHSSTRSAFHNIAASPTERLTGLTDGPAQLVWTSKVDLKHPVTQLNRRT